MGDYGQIIVDECHHISAFRFEQVLNKAPARHVLGMTATPIRRDGHEPIIFLQCGPIRYKSNRGRASKARRLKQIVIPRPTDFRLSESKKEPSIQEVLGRLASDSTRNDLIFDDVVSAIDRGKKPLLLTERVAQLQHFESRLRKFCQNVFVFKGGQGPAGALYPEPFSRVTDRVGSPRAEPGPSSTPRGPRPSRGWENISSAGAGSGHSRQPSRPSRAEPAKPARRLPPTLPCREDR